MNLKDITLKNISDYITGNLSWLGAQFNLQSKSKKEQILYRATQCPPECAKHQECWYCKCDFPQKLYVKESCNKGKQLPPLMDEENWEEYKQTLKIKNKNEKRT